MGEELGRCRFYGVEVVTLCRLEVTQRNKLIDAPWPELHTTCRMPSRRRVSACALPARWWQDRPFVPHV